MQMPGMRASQQRMLSNPRVVVSSNIMFIRGKDAGEQKQRVQACDCRRYSAESEAGMHIFLKLLGSINKIGKQGHAIALI